MTPFPWHAARILLYLILGVIGVRLLRSNWSAVSPALETWWASGRAEVATGSAYRHQVDSLRAIARTAIHAAQRLAQDTAALRHARDSALAHAADLAAHAGDSTMQFEIRRIGQACTREMQSCQAIAAKWETAARENQVLAERAIARAAHADSVIHTGLAVTQCKILFLRCPSRIAALEWGFVGGVLTGVVVARH